jgi:hypothetical protein
MSFKAIIEHNKMVVILESEHDTPGYFKTRKEALDDLYHKEYNKVANERFLLQRKEIWLASLKQSCLTLIEKHKYSEII